MATVINVPIRLYADTPDGRVSGLQKRVEQEFAAIGKPFTARPGRWIGTKVRQFGVVGEDRQKAGHADVDWFRIE